MISIRHFGWNFSTPSSHMDYYSIEPDALFLCIKNGQNTFTEENVVLNILLMIAPYGCNNPKTLQNMLYFVHFVRVNGPSVFKYHIKPKYTEQK